MKPIGQPEPLCAICPEKHEATESCNAFPGGIPQSLVEYLRAFLPASRKGKFFIIVTQIEFCQALYARLASELI